MTKHRITALQIITMILTTALCFPVSVLRAQKSYKKLNQQSNIGLIWDSYLFN